MPSRPRPAGSLARRVRCAVRSAVFATVGEQLLERTVAARVPGWRRTNYRGATVSLSGGAAAAIAALTGAHGPSRRAASIAGSAAALAGGYDDLCAPRAESSEDKGLRGHLAAARQGRISGGVLKVAVIGASAVLAGADLAPRGRPMPSAVADVLLRAFVIAGCANVLNLLDLRPGRAGKVALVGGALGSSGPSGAIGAAVAGAAAGALPGDLRERSLQGDLGANTLGALLGVRLAAGSLPTRLAAAAVVAGLTAANERVSFSAVIDSTPALRRLDRLGRMS